MASTWGLSWGVSWGVSWDFGDAPVEILAGGKTSGKTPWHKGYKGSLEKDLGWRCPIHTIDDKREDITNIRRSAQILSSAGGFARAKSLTSKQRTNIATIAAKARWK